MKPLASSTTLEGNLSGEVVEYSIDSSQMAHIMSLLTNAYEDSILAFIREYFTNAWDSHVEAGRTRPVEVTLPSSMMPVYVIRDFGTGLSMDEIRNVYTCYGTSTKRDSDEVNGMLGIGSKSALAYADQFTIVSIKNGLRITASVSRDSKGAASLQVADMSPTDDPDGVEITIPVQDAEAVRKRAKKFFSYIEPGRVLVDGEAPDRSDWLDLGDGLWMRPDDRQNWTRTGEVTALMGNVPYPVPQDIVEEASRSMYWSGWRPVIEVPIGGVQFPPSRESVMDTPHSRNTLLPLMEKLIERVEEHVQEQVDACDTAQEALEEMGRLSGLAVVRTWRGKQAPTSHRPYYNGHPTTPAKTVDLMGVSLIGRQAKVTEVYLNSPPTMLNESLVLTGCEVASMSKNVRDYITDSFADKGHVIRTIICEADDKPQAGIRDWIPAERVMDYNDLKSEMRKNNVSVSSGGTKGPSKADKYPAAASYGQVIDIITLQNAKRVAWVPTNGAGIHHGALAHMRDKQKWLIIKLAANRKDKFLREVPHALDPAEAMKKAAGIDRRKLRKTDLRAARMYNMLVDLPDYDGDVQKVLDACDDPNPAPQKGSDAAHEYLSRWYRVDDEKPDTLDNNPFEKYPMLRWMEAYGFRREEMISDATDYVNAIYQHNKKESQ